MWKIFQEYPNLLECVELYGKSSNKSETYHKLRRNVPATSMKIFWKNLYWVKWYATSNMNVFTLSIWENFQWGLIYYDQFKSHIESFELSNS